MPLTFTTGKTFANGEVLTPAKLNQAVNSTTYTGELEVAKGGSGAGTAAGARTAFGLFGSNLEDSVVGTIQTGTLATDLIYTSGPSLSLTAGLWLVWGSASARLTDTAGEYWLGLRDTTGNTDFGKGATVKDTGTSIIHHLSCFGYITVASSATIRLKAFVGGSYTLELGAPVGVSGALRAIRLTT